MQNRTMAWKVGLLFFICLLLQNSVYAQISYSIPEEMDKGSLVGNISQDLGLDLKRLIIGKARIYTGDSSEYIELNREKGVLLVKERIDREFLCRQISPCALHFQVILENPMEFYSISVEITDVNDNPPFFKKPEMYFEISELAQTGAKFTLERAIDLDVGINGLHSYFLNSSDIFVLNSQKLGDMKKVEMVLQKQLDHEKQKHISLVLTAIDGGVPQRSGTMQIQIAVLDANDNAPVCSQSVFKTTVVENSPKNTIVATVIASDADDSSNGKINYAISSNAGEDIDMFEINETNGVLKLIGNIDFEVVHTHEIDIQVTDQGGHSDSCKVIIDVLDINDNTPTINIMSNSKTISENSLIGTVIAILNTADPDSGENGKVQCLLNDDVPFILKFTSANFFSLVTYSALDRERVNEYNITVTCTDEGTPSLSSSVSLFLHISDINDNPPVFERSSYEAFLIENNTPGTSITTVNARDADWNQNARVLYILEDSTLNGVLVSSYVSIDADSGVVHAVRSFDYEQIKNIQFLVKAQDGGSPPLISNVSVKITIQDQNDNAPQVLYPIQTGGSLVAEIVPRSADVGYLVTKVVAVDMDSGQNAWLSYKLHKPTDRGLFEVDLQNGEVRTVRQVTDKDAMKQKLTVVVEDNGQPSRSATVNINVAVADSLPTMLSDFTEFANDKEYNYNLTFYLVLALTIVSFLFIVSIIAILSVKCYRWRRERMFFKSDANLPVIPYYPTIYADVGDTGTLQHLYNNEVYRTSDTRKSGLKYIRPSSPSIISLDTSGTQTVTNTQSEKFISGNFVDQVRNIIQCE